MASVHLEIAINQPNLMGLVVDVLLNLNQSSKLPAPCGSGIAAQEPSVDAQTPLPDAGLPTVDAAGNGGDNGNSNNQEEGEDNDSLGSFASDQDDLFFSVGGSDHDQDGETEDEGRTGDDGFDEDAVLLRGLMQHDQEASSDVEPTTPIETPPGWEGNVTHDDVGEFDRDEPEAKRQKVTDDPTIDSAPSSPTPVPAVPASSSGAPRTRIYSSPDHILQKISPLPGCRLSLNFNDWRWVSQWRKNLDCDQWLDELKRKSYSQVFSRDDWKEKLRNVHEHAWLKWEIAKDHMGDALKLSADIVPQAPGEIPETIFDELQAIVDGLQEKKRYYSKKK